MNAYMRMPWYVCTRNTSLCIQEENGIYTNMLHTLIDMYSHVAYVDKEYFHTGLQYMCV